MISVIISSQDKETLEKVSTNIANTIGVPFELIAFENSNGKKGICEVYNRGIDQSKFDILCFTHEDVFFETINWGKKVAAHLEDKKIGLVGLAGGDTKSIVPSSWSSSVFQSEINIIQHSKDKTKPAEHILKTGYPEDNSTLKQVVAIDGVWMCTRKDVTRRFKFDTENFSGFHGYDIDFSLQVQTTYKVGVLFDLILHHFSDGSYNRAWMESMITVSEKWKKRLPVSVRQLSKEELVRQHWTTMKNFLSKLNRLEYSRLTIFSHFLKYSFNKYFHVASFLHVLRLLLQNDWDSQEN